MDKSIIFYFSLYLCSKILVVGIQMKEVTVWKKVKLTTQISIEVCHQMKEKVSKRVFLERRSYSYDLH